MAKKTARPQNDDSTPQTPQAKPRRSRARAGDAGEQNATAVAPTPPAATAADTATANPPRSLSDVSDIMAEAQAPRPHEDEHADDHPAEGGPVESMSSEPSEEDIRLRAYHRYLERGAEHGAHFDDWLEAERELKHRR